MNNGIRYYRQPVIDLIARNVLDGYDRRLLIGKPTAIPIDDIIESLGLIVEYHYLRNCDRICGETVFDTAEVIVYDMEKRKYKTIIVKGGTIIADAHLLDSGNEGRLRFTFAHELAHWILHKNIFCGSQYSAAMTKVPITEDCKLSSEVDRAIERQADMLGTALIMPITQVKRAYYAISRNQGSTRMVIDRMAEIFNVSREAMRIRLSAHNLI